MAGVRKGHPVPAVLVAGGLDPTSGAGVVADALRVHRAGAHPLVVLTASTVQDTRGVGRVHPVAAPHFREQLEGLLEDVRPAAVKTGLLPTAVHVETLAARIPRGCPLVVDPVLASSGGYLFSGPDARRALARLLVPRATLLTPNLPELGELTELPVDTAAGRRRAALALLRLGAGAVLVKGGHGGGARATDVLYTRRGARAFSASRLPGDVHGTGCALAASIAARLALGDDLEAAVRFARAAVRRGIRRAWRLGRGRRLLGR